MDIECKLIRKGGTEVPLGDINYHFKPLEDGAHVAAVEVDEHIDIFLGIPEAYRPYRGKAQAPAAPVASQVPDSTSADEAAKNTGGTPGEYDAADNIILGASNYPASFAIHGKDYALGDVVALAHKDSGLDVAEWNGLSEDTRADMIDEALDKLNADTVAPDEARAAAAQLYEAKFGKKPHWRWSAEKILAEVNEA